VNSNGMGAFWEALRLQSHVTTIPSVNDGLIDRVFTLRDFETLGVHCKN
jgi:hypothetical protein